MKTENLKTTKAPESVHDPRTENIEGELDIISLMIMSRMPLLSNNIARSCTSLYVY